MGAVEKVLSEALWNLCDPLCKFLTYCYTEIHRVPIAIGSTEIHREEQSIIPTFSTAPEQNDSQFTFRIIKTSLL